MKKIYITLLGFVLLLSSCADILDVDPKNKVSANELFGSPEGVEAHMANLYGRLAIEDFTYSPNRGFNIGVHGSDVNNSGFMSAHYCDEAIHPEYNDFGEETFDIWEGTYKLIRDINNVLLVADELTIIEKEDKDKLIAEAHFLRAYSYFALAKRYGGLPIIKAPQEYTGDTEALRVPRSTEEATWDFILDECDEAIKLFDEATEGYKKAGRQEKSTESRRADRWVTLALKSRVALHAGSIAKFTREPYVSLSGLAYDAGLVGIDILKANHYYEECMKASAEIMANPTYELYMPNPSSPEEAASNYARLFENPKQFLSGTREIILVKGYALNSGLAHNYDVWFSPRQVILDPNLYPSRMNPTLDFIDAFEDYTDNGTGASKPLRTRHDGNESNYNGFNLSTNYIKYPQNEPYKIAENKDARLRAMVLFPGEKWNGTKIVIQGGMIKANGTGFHYITQAAEKGLDGLTYFTFGAEKSTDYSGFDPTLGNYTRSGFLFKKFLQIQNPIELAWGRSTQDWIEFRYAEILLNYAEAAIERTNVGSTDLAKAKDALNAIRKRAAHTDEISLTRNNVRKERFVELAFENKRRWDLIRWRTFHDEFENRVRKGLVPFLDLRTNPAQYIFVRVNPQGIEAKTFEYSWYYKNIPGIGSNGLIQNP